MKTFQTRTTELPRVSVLIPAFAANAFVHEAVNSVFNQDYPHIETIVIPDDGSTYSHLRHQIDSPRLRLLVPDTHAGTAGAFNRGIDAATGDFIAACDADDLWPSNYISELVPLAIQAGAAAAPTVYTDWDGQKIRVPPIQPQCLSLSGYAQLVASIRPLIHRSYECGYIGERASDVLHDMHVIAAAGGQIPVVNGTHYQARERIGSATDTGGKDSAYQQAYTSLAHAARHHPTRVGLQRLSTQDRLTIAYAFDFRRFVSEQYEQCAEPGQTYNRFVAEREARLWDEFYAFNSRADRNPPKQAAAA